MDMDSKLNQQRCQNCKPGQLSGLFSLPMGLPGGPILACLAVLLASELLNVPGSTVLVAEEKKPAAESSVSAIILEQEVKGLPGLKSEITARQRITIHPGGKRLLLEALPATKSSSPSTKTAETDGKKPTAPNSASVLLSSEGANRVILDMSTKPPEIYEIIDDQKRFKARSANLSHLQNDRDDMDLHILNYIERSNLKKTEVNKLLAENHLRLDGKRVVKVSHGEKREILGYPCQEVIITENGRQVIQAWMTTEITGGKSFYELYQSLGAFSKEVLEKVRGVEGLPLKAKIKVVTAAPAYDIEANCLEVKKGVQTSMKVFSPPGDYKKIEEIPGIVPCPICGKELEWDQPGGIANDPINGKEYRTCSRECHKKMKEIINKKVEERFKKPERTKKPK